MFDPAASTSAPTCAPTSPLISLRRVSAGYGSTLALDSIDLDIHGGTHVLLTGSNGSGKSTLLSVLAGVQPPAGGQLVRRRDTSIAFVVQHSAVPTRLPVTVRETVSMGRWRSRGALGRLRSHDRDLVDASLEALEIADLARRSLHDLSGGQRQRALVAQGLASRADVLLLDEPTAAVDEASRGLIDEAIASELGRGAAVVHASHDPLAPTLADVHVRLESGRVVEHSPPRESAHPSTS